MPPERHHHKVHVWQVITSVCRSPVLLSHKVVPSTLATPRDRSEVSGRTYQEKVHSVNRHGESEKIKPPQGAFASRSPVTIRSTHEQVSSDAADHFSTLLIRYIRYPLTRLLSGFAADVASAHPIQPPALLRASPTLNLRGHKNGLLEACSLHTLLDHVEPTATPPVLPDYPTPLEGLLRCLVAQCHCIVMDRMGLPSSIHRIVSTLGQEIITIEVKKPPLALRELLLTVLSFPIPASPFDFLHHDVIVSAAFFGSSLLIR